ncbi:MAG: LPS assembly lipoprotein LptE [Polynucleobacter sp.]|nr:LPS assembly lipoprotein LptE [Polynucleobacter sp.]
MDRRTWLGVLIALPALFTSACGFKLRGSVSIPYKVIVITGAPSPLLRADLEMIILTGSNAKVATNAKDADLILEIISEVNSREILAYNAAGQISAYRLNSRVAFQAIDQNGVDVVPESEIYVTRDMDFSVSTVLATDVQQQQFTNAMRMDLALQILRRIAASAKPRVPASTGAKPVMGKP